MIKEAIDRILGLAGVEQFEIDGREYTNRRLEPVMLPEPAPLTIHTLTGIRDYLAENTDGLTLDELMIHVVGPDKVMLFSRLSGGFEQRKRYLGAIYDGVEFSFGKYLDVETFIVELQAKFVQDEMTAAILQLVGTITDEVVATYADDGVTQGVTAKSGLGRVEKRAVPNPVELRPYRTFNEIEQPAGRFVLRLKSGLSAGARPQVALFDADGGAWRLEAIKRIRNWLRTAVPEDVAVIA